MANIKSAIKRIKVTKRQHEENLAHRTKAKTFVKKANASILTGDKEAAPVAVKAAVKVLDTVARKGVIHKNKAARLTSRLTKKANALVNDTTVVTVEKKTTKATGAKKKSTSTKTTAKKTATKTEKA